jgi:hypothetical protein
MPMDKDLLALGEAFEFLAEAIRMFFVYSPLRTVVARRPWSEGGVVDVMECGHEMLRLAALHPVIRPCCECYFAERRECLH